ncbi:ras-GEF domain-containing family member 1B [Phlebotomus papatasi]|uniref:ras-GEF domain-containing family member 1B n=1 Tax=Phlebotomus papatasi TaxID=29031 RepID=UPI0024839D7D|nr:ras-GEF domain-containing family member 1B [Phlebotomus papatasi]
MAMYYYASKLSAVACGARCKQSVSQRNRRRGTGRRSVGGSCSEDDEKDDDNDDNDTADHYATTKSSSSQLDSDPKTIHGTSTQPPEVACENPPPSLANAALGPGGVMYSNGNAVSGPLDSLIDLLIPAKCDEFDKDYVFSFLLSSRLFVRPHELLGRLLSSVPDHEPLDRLVGLLGLWTKTFPYDFRDERIMCHVKHIVARCANTELGDRVSDLLCALLNRLTDLEHHEEELRACQSNTEKTNMKWTSASQLAQLLCRIERKLAKHVGPEEFLQCNGNVLSKQEGSSVCAQNGTPGNQDPKKTCNLETYLDWSARLRLLVSNDILQCDGITERSRIVEMWSGAAQYCLLVGNYNSATAILESLDATPVARLTGTWSKLSSTSQQLDCMQRHAEGCGDLWHKQTESSMESGTATDKIRHQKQKSTTHISPKVKSSDWVVIPVFADIVRLALIAREDCLTKLPNGHLNVAAFDRLAAVVGAFARHMSDVSAPLATPGEFESLWRHMQQCNLLNETDLLLASFDCEPPTASEKLNYNIV